MYPTAYNVIQFKKIKFGDLKKGDLYLDIDPNVCLSLSGQLLFSVYEKLGSSMAKVVSWPFPSARHKIGDIINKIHYTAMVIPMDSLEAEHSLRVFVCRYKDNTHKSFINPMDIEGDPVETKKISVEFSGSVDDGTAAYKQIKAWEESRETS